MHSRIFQLSKEPITKEHYIDSYEFDEHWFTNQVADYVAGCDREDAIDWLKSCVKGCEVNTDANGVYILVLNKEEYFTSAYEKFKKTLEKLKVCTLEQFASNALEFDIWRIQNSYSEKHGFYVYSDELVSFDHFIRFAELNQKYYIGNALDYHS